ncbi:hypothetical protein ACVRXQ_02890 [Streptococcus panodentis]|uniref:Uncharacterized protein n=1 Tax=Streptococcus panodentis TaxID=1581472 RepID=A0ABS5AYV0_9STRE|nr:hypothetical protein [Streptococcus panodentis]MBP2621767.1 hypothetical protein [Streptococcus panodentis]
MRKKVVAGLAVLFVLISGGIFYMVNLQKTSSGLDVKEEKLIKHGFRLLEEQLATYIKEHYSGVSKIEFSPIFIEGGKDNPPFTADIVPVVYDEEGNRAVLGTQIGNTGYPSYGNIANLDIDFDYAGNEFIYLKSSSKGLDVDINVSNQETLPEEAKIKTEIKGMDANIEALVKDGQLKNITKSEIGSPKAEINYNLEIKRGDYSTWK